MWSRSVGILGFRGFDDRGFDLPRFAGLRFNGFRGVVRGFGRFGFLDLLGGFPGRFGGCGFGRFGRRVFRVLFHGLIPFENPELRIPPCDIAGRGDSRSFGFLVLVEFQGEDLPRIGQEMIREMVSRLVGLNLFSDGFHPFRKL